MQRIGLGLVVSLLILCGCASNATPTAFPTGTPAPTQPRPTDAPTPTPLVRPTLPPTWTPVPSLTPTLTPAFAALATGLPLPEECVGFGEDPERNSITFDSGQPPQVYWLPVAGAVTYRITLYDEAGEVLLEDETAEITYRFDDYPFVFGQTYGWDVMPLDARRQQLCPPQGNILLPS